MSQPLLAARSVPAREPILIRPESAAAPLRRGLQYAYYGGQVAFASVLFAIEAPKLSGDLTLFVILVLLEIAANQLAFRAYGDVLLSSDFALVMAILVL